ncbi:MAG: sigma 54-interacting transcriptional regulator [Planctomycetes bacterium]|nr:sigma 54-interacting transcriptional regulator [Planctomycetota bacterium]
MTDPARELLWLRRLRDLSHRLAAEQDVRRLLPAILDAAIELAQAERGFLVRVDPPRKGEARVRIRVDVARGFDQETLQGAQGKVSRTVVERVLARGRAVITTSEEDQDLREVSSVQARKVLSILCVPMLLRGEPRGVLYLDHRFDPRAFSEQDLPVVAAFADQAAVALETAELLAAREAEERADAPDEPPADPGVAPPFPPGEGPLRYGRLIGASAPMRALYAGIERAARSSALVLITGESGTGKELVAREIHARGQRPDEPFLSENCAAIADTLLESELFGHRRGAFTGATADRKGLFHLAGRGTLFLDEVGDTSPSMQAKLLRVLQEGVARPVGGAAAQPVACRVIAATHRDLKALVGQGAFREDLYYRLDVLRIHVPPLRQRPEDIPPLLAHFLEAEGGGHIEVTPKALELLVGYSWPGNVRELENEARRLATLGEPKLTARHLSPDVAAGRGLARAGGGYSGKTLGEVEREMVAAALRETGGNKARAARQLGIPKTTLYHLIERYQLS